MNFLIDCIIVWRVTHLLVLEDGPFKIIYNFQLRLKKRGGFSWELIKCFYCLSVWAGAAVAVLRGGVHLSAIGYALALSGGSILLQLISGDK